MPGEFVVPTPETLLSRVEAVAAGSTDAETLPTAVPESQQDGLLRRTEEVAEQRRIVESNPELPGVLAAELTEMQNLIEAYKPKPGQSAEDYHRELVFKLQGHVKKATDKFPAPESPYAEQFK